MMNYYKMAQKSDNPRTSNGVKLIVGLGNPGKKYENTRHNGGFRVLDALALSLRVRLVSEPKFFSELGKTADRKIMLAKPATFMNESGKAVASLKNFYKLGNADILIVHDEIDLPLGTLRLAKNSGSAGHKGAQSVIESVGKDIRRLRIGVDNRADRLMQPTDDYVLQNFTSEEEKKLGKEIIPQAISEIKNSIL